MSTVKPIGQQLAEHNARVEARDRAAQTPEEVRKAFLAGTKTVGPISLQPFSLGILWLLEEIDHPIIKPAAELKAKDVSRAIAIFSDPEGAGEAIKSAGLDALDEFAMPIVSGISMAWLSEIIAAIVEIITEGLATIPGGGKADPPSTGS